MRANPLLVLVLGAATACAGSGASPEARPAGNRGSVTVLTRAELRRSGGGDLLTALAGRIALMRVERRSAASPCPVITLRGDRTVIGSRNPMVFVDGTEMSDTCVLQQIRTDDVSSVEVYPGGLTQRPGYRAHANGLIVIFLVGADTVPADSAG